LLDTDHCLLKSCDVIYTCAAAFINNFVFARCKPYYPRVFSNLVSHKFDGKIIETRISASLVSHSVETPEMSYYFVIIIIIIIIIMSSSGMALHLKKGNCYVH
jgi:uncharacterized protein YacL